MRKRISGWLYDSQKKHVQAFELSNDQIRRKKKRKGICQERKLIGQHFSYEIWCSVTHKQFYLNLAGIFILFQNV